MDVQFGSVEAIAQASSYTDATGAALDYDGTNNYAQLTAKTTGVASIGLRLRAIIAGVLTSLLTFAPGSTTATFAGDVSVQVMNATRSVLGGVAGANTLTVTGPATTGQSFGLQVTAGTNSADRSAVFQTAAGNTILLLSGDRTAAFSGAVTMNVGLTVSAGGLAVNSGTTAVQALTATSFSVSTAGTSHPYAVGAWGAGATYNFLSLNNDFGSTSGIGLAGGGGTDTNIWVQAATNGDVIIRTSGTGNLRLASSYAAGAPTATGYVNVKDGSGSLIKLVAAL